MKTCSRYALDPSGEGERARLRNEGGSPGIEVDGRSLEAQFELADGSGLVWLTDDSPYDEGLHVYLLGTDGRIEDAVEAGADFTAGVLEVMATGPDWVDVSFFRNERVYRIQVGEEARPRFSTPTGWRYKKRLGRHRLTVDERAREEA